MSSRITNELPAWIDRLLMNMAQGDEFTKISYTDISNFGEKATKEDLKRLRKLGETYEDIIVDYSDDCKEELRTTALEIEKIVKKYNN